MFLRSKTCYIKKDNNKIEAPIENYKTSVRTCLIPEVL